MSFWDVTGGPELDAGRPELDARRLDRRGKEDGPGRRIPSRIPSENARRRRDNARGEPGRRLGEVRSNANFNRISKSDLVENPLFPWDRSWKEGEGECGGGQAVFGAVGN